MTQRLPLVAAQPGIWMAEKLSILPSAWSVAHYVELTGELNAPLLAKAVVVGLGHADTLRMRFSEDNGEVWQWVDPALTFAEPEIIDVRDMASPHDAARALMQADVQQDIRADGAKPWSAINLFKWQITVGTGISAIIICWWMASVFRRLPAR